MVYCIILRYMCSRSVCSIQPEHALVEYDGKKKVTLLPLPGAKVVLNGNEIKEKKELHHNDR